MLTDNSYGKFKYILYRPDGGGEIGSDLGKLKKREPNLALSKGTGRRLKGA